MSSGLSLPHTGAPVCVQGFNPRSLSHLRLLRLSVTDLCNFRCRYCMPAAGLPRLRHDDMPSLEELVRQVNWIVGCSKISKVRLTGGEPLVRPGMEQLVAALAANPALREISLTTNGTLLPELAWKLKAAGLARVNISLDSLDPERFAVVTRGGSLERTLAGIEAAQQAGLTPIKLNTVLHRSTWRQEVPALLDFAATHQFEIRFIELMRTGTELAWCESEYISADEVGRELGVPLAAYPGAEHDRSPARRTLLRWKGSLLTVGWISPRSHPFCASCERLRMDARGRVYRCLMDPSTLDLPKLLRTQDDAAARETFASYIARKVSPRAMESATTMNQIGG
jgi:cyclic pyranopterin phosphate synthase